MKLKAVKDPIGGYRVQGTEIIWARFNECRCCWYVFDSELAETIDSGLSYAQAKARAFEYVEEMRLQDA
jgi:hypothetical protein